MVFTLQVQSVIDYTKMTAGLVVVFNLLKTSQIVTETLKRRDLPVIFKWQFSGS